MTSTKGLFCWGVLLHFLGFESKSASCLDLLSANVNQSAFDRHLLTTLQLVNDLGAGSRRESSTRSDRLKELFALATDIIDPGTGRERRHWPQLHRECEPAKATQKNGDLLGSDDPAKGYSRYPFCRFDNESVARDVQLATMSYLLRAYAGFFSQEPGNRDYYLAKASLNDLYQAQQMTWRLYENHDLCHRKQESLQPFVQKVAATSQRHVWREEPHRSAFFTWASLASIDIQKGNVFYHLHHSDAAIASYRRVISRLRTVRSTPPLSSELRTSADSWWAATHPWWQASPTIIESLFEYSKLLFDEGHFLDSLRWQTKCLVLVLMSKRTWRTNAISAITLLRKTTALLEAEKANHIWDKALVTRAFGDPSQLSDTDRGSFQVKSLYGCVPKRLEFLVVDVLARIGFTLFTLKDIPSIKGSSSDEQVNEANALETWLQSYFRADRILQIERESPMGIYCETLLPQLGANNEWRGKDLFSRYPERRLSLRLRELVAARRGPSESGFIELLEATTQNIGNMITIPRRNQRLLMRPGYMGRRVLLENWWNQARGDTRKSELPPRDKLAILRRWQSYNPKLPHPGAKRLRGGGYLLLWKGRGIAVDPGYDFIQNLYDEGFSLEDIDAVVLSHSHADHDDDLWTLLTLVNEWNDYHSKLGRVFAKKELDLFLNESGYRKFSTWVHARKMVLGRIVPLPLLVWDKDSKAKEKNDPDSGTPFKSLRPIRGPNVMIDLRGQDGYNLVLEVVPAWHDDVINSTGAAGFKFHLYENDSETVKCTIGITGDTGAYGVQGRAERDSDSVSIVDHYKSCDVLVAHLGDIKVRELESGASVDQGRGFSELLPLTGMLHDFFCETNERSITTIVRDRITPRSVSEFLHLLIALDLVSTSVMGATVRAKKNAEPISVGVGKIIDDFLSAEWSQTLHFDKSILDAVPIEALLKDALHERAPEHEIVLSWTSTLLRELSIPEERHELEREEVIFGLLTIVCLATRSAWQYEEHLGAIGLCALARGLGKDKEGIDRRYRLLIVGELPEELASYRHRVARWLNQWIRQMSKQEKWHNKVYAYTGDIGMHIGFEKVKKHQLLPKLRCHLCNHNNETAKRREGYYTPDKISESMIKRNNAAMAYLCTEHDHHPALSEDKYLHFLNDPEINVMQ